LRLARAQPERRHRLAELSHYLKTRLRSLGLEVVASPAPITAFALESHAAMQDLQYRLFAQHILVVISNYIGAGPHGMIRLATFADHTPEDIDRLVDVVRTSV
jgi:7-keto-8-aminopelargonate synthetase-like enzyme